MIGLYPLVSQYKSDRFFKFHSHIYIICDKIITTLSIRNFQNIFYNYLRILHFRKVIIWRTRTIKLLLTQFLGAAISSCLRDGDQDVVGTCFFYVEIPRSQSLTDRQREVRHQQLRLSICITNTRLEYCSIIYHNSVMIH